MAFAYYERLTRAEQAIYRASDGISSVVLPDAPSLRPVVVELEDALKADNRDTVAEVANRLVRAITEEQIAAMRNPALVPNTKLPRIEDAVKAGGFLAGTPADIIEQLKAVEKRYPGLERVICTMPLGTPLSVTLEQIERFANEVMPAFKSMKAAAD